MPSTQPWYRQVQFPRGIELFFIVLCLAIYMFSAAFVLNGDGGYGYAMVQRMADPHAFADNDLSVMGGLKGNFLFYKSLYFLPYFQQNFVAVDFAVSSVLSILLLLAWYNIIALCTTNKAVRVLSFLFIFFVDRRLALGGTTLPLFYLSSISSVHFLQIFALFFYFKQYYRLSFALLALTTYFHPASGLFFLAALSCVLAWQSMESKQYRVLVQSALLAACIIVPNYLLIMHNLTPVQDVEKYFQIFHDLSSPEAGHIYIASNIHAYIYVFTAFALFTLVYYKKKLTFAYDRLIFRILLVSLVLVGLWLINVYFVHNLQIFFLFFAMRSSYLTKPFLIFIIVSLAYATLQKKDPLAVGVAVALMLSLVVPSVVWSWALLMVGFVYFVSDSDIKPRLRWPTSWPRAYAHVVRNKQLVVLLPAIIIGLLSAGYFAYRFNNKLYKVYRLLHGENLFNFSFDASKNYGITKARPSYGALIDWAKQYKGKMFVIPPDDCRFSGPFRFLTKNSVYINICDAGQMNYEPAEFMAGYDRLLQVKMVYKRWGVLDYSGYNAMTLTELRQLPADFVIFDKTSAGYVPKNAPPIFENDEYIVYSLH